MREFYGAQTIGIGRALVKMFRSIVMQQAEFQYDLAFLFDAI